MKHFTKSDNQTNIKVDVLQMDVLDFNSLINQLLDKIPKEQKYFSSWRF